MILGLSTGTLLTLGGKAFSGLLKVFEGKRKSKEFMAVILLQLEEAEDLLGDIVKQLEDVSKDEEMVKNLSSADIRLHTYSLSLLKNRMDRLGDMVRGSDDDIPEIK